MATVSRTGTVQSTHHSKNPSTGNHTYSATVKYNYETTNPSPPPPTVEVEVTEVHENLDESFYRDFVSALAGGKAVTHAYEPHPDANRTV